MPDFSRHRQRVGLHPAVFRDFALPTARLTCRGLPRMPAGYTQSVYNHGPQSYDRTVTTTAIAANSTPPFTAQIGVLLRHWRAARRLSQLDLALEAGISSRHLSYV